MIKIKTSYGELSPQDQNVINSGFERHSNQTKAPSYPKEKINWCVYNDENVIVGALTADILWDWLYVDELWTDESIRGQGCGTRLMNEAENHARESQLSGIWLWTQSWQAMPFYQRLGYEEFARFPEFPKGHYRVGFRKQISGNVD